MGMLNLTGKGAEWELQIVLFYGNLLFNSMTKRLIRQNAAFLLKKINHAHQ